MNHWVTIICCLAVLFSGCTNLQQQATDDPSPQTSLPQHADSTGAITPEQIFQHEALAKVELPKQPPRVHVIDLTGEYADVFERVRQGFAMPDINDDLVLYHQQWYLNQPDYLRRMVDRSSRYLYHIVDELEKRGLPMELALLPMVESAYNPMALSRSKASGLWQFIPSTGRRYNLDQSWWKDERRDIVASTSAALDYLQSIYEMHGDWHLALASYNCGEGAVGRAIVKNRDQGLPTDYLNLTLPDETRNYVPKLQALKNIFTNRSLFSELDLPKVPNEAFFATITIDFHIDVKLAAKLAEMPVQDFMALNPAHNRPVIEPDTALILPKEKVATFTSNLEAHESENKPFSEWKTYILRPGDQLNKVASRFGMTLAQLRQANGLDKKTRPTPGTPLLVVGRNQGNLRDKTILSDLVDLPDSTKKTHTHTIRKGDTLSVIARQYGLNVDELKRINGLSSNKIVVGKELQLTEGAFPSRRTSPDMASNSAKKSITIVRPGQLTPAPMAQTTRYQVRQGDTIYSIARQFKVTVNDLIRLNQVNPGKLKIGTFLTIPHPASS